MKTIVIHLKYVVVAGFILQLTTGVSAPEAMACDKCQRPNVALYDSQVVPPRPTGDSSDPTLAQKILEWRNLFWVSAGVKDYVMNGDPQRDCITVLDGAFFTKEDNVSSSITFGSEWCNLPPANGAPGDQDYLITGSVDGTAGNYVFTVQLQVSKTREVVAQRTATFSLSSGALDAGSSAAAQLGSIIDQIREFEKRKRAQGAPYALWPIAELHPRKNPVDKNGSAQVDVYLYDCDGTIETSPLANRTITLSVEGGGSLQDATVTTGSDGKAVATFVAGATPGEALLDAVYPYRLASEYESVNNGGNGSIRITDVPPTLWQVSGTIHEHHTYDETKTSDMYGLTDYDWQGSANDSLYNVNAVVRNVAQDTSRFQSDTAPLRLSITGSHSEMERTRRYEQSSAFWTKSWSVRNVSAFPVPSNDPDIGLPYIGLKFVDTADGSGNARYVSLSGWTVQGPSIQVGQKCYSDGSCQSDNYSGDTTGIIEYGVGTLYDDAGVNSQTTYTDLSNTTWTVTERASIVKTAVGYSVSKHYTSDGYQPPGTSSLKKEKRQGMLVDIALNFTPLGSAPSPPAFSPGAIPSAVANAPYQGSVAASGGTPPYNYTVTSGALPDGLTLDPSTGDVSGTPTTAGTATFTVKVTDSKQQTTTQSFSIIVSTTLPPVRVVGAAIFYYQTIHDALSTLLGGGSATIEARAVELMENVDLSTNSTVTLHGGYDNSFTSNGGFTKLHGGMNVARGALTVDGLTIK